MAVLRTELGNTVSGPNVAAIVAQIPVTTVTPVIKRGFIWFKPKASTPPGPRKLGQQMFHAGPATELAAGNEVKRGDARTGAPAYPGLGLGGAATPLPPERYIQNRDAFPWIARTPAFQHGRLIARDRHIIADHGTVKSSDDPANSGGYPNPDHDGPGRPGYRMIDRTLSWLVGTDATRQLDNDAFHAVTTTTDGRRFPLGDQGMPWTSRNGGTPFLYRPYGARGYVEGPSPALRALPGDGSGLPAGTPMAPGDPLDGPQKVYGGLPHGLHSPTVPPPVVTQARQASIPQQRATWQFRPALSKIAGQSYSQTVVHLDGTGGGPLPRISEGRAPGVNGRFTSK